METGVLTSTLASHLILTVKETDGIVMPKGGDVGNHLLCDTAGHVIDMGYQCCLQLILKDCQIICATPSARLIGENGHPIPLADVRVGHCI